MAGSGGRATWQALWRIAQRHPVTPQTLGTRAWSRSVGLGPPAGSPMQTAHDMTAGSRGSDQLSFLKSSFLKGTRRFSRTGPQYPSPAAGSANSIASAELAASGRNHRGRRYLSRGFMTQVFSVDARAAAWGRAAMAGNAGRQLKAIVSRLGQARTSLELTSHIRQSRQIRQNPHIRQHGPARQNPQVRQHGQPAQPLRIGQSRQTGQNPQMRQSRFHSQAHGRGQQAGKGGSAGAAEAPPVGGYVGWYLRTLQEKPVLTKCVTAGAILVAADATTQILTIEGELPPLSESATVFDFARLARMAAIGLFLWGPSLHLWYGLMARRLPGTDLLSVFQKMALGQVSYGPAFTAVFFSINGAAQGETPHEIWLRLKRDLIPTLVNGLCYWPLCDIINFRYVPVHLQPLGNNCAALIWNVYVTYVASKGKAD